MAKGVYTVHFENVAVAAAQDFFELRPGTTDAKPITLVGLFLGNISAEGDANEDFLRYQILSMIGGTFTSGSGGSTPTPQPTEDADDAAGFAADANNTTQASTTGTTSVKHSDTFNVRTGLQLILPPDMRPTIYGLANSALLVRLLAAPDASTNMSGTVYVKEGI